MVCRAGSAVGLCPVAAFGGTLLLAALLAGCGSGGGSDPAPTQHRSSALVTGTPESAEYDYDGAGNLRQVRPQQVATLSITGLVPSRGGVGQPVLISGIGFSPITSQTTVRLSGVAATITWATSSELAFLVPPGATTGKVTVSVGGSSATSASDFTVVTGVEIADFDPKVGRAGTILTVTGSNFAATPAANAVEVGGGTALPTAASPTALLATLGAGATSGKVRVTAGGSSATSAADFYLLPAGASALDVAFKARASPGSPVTVGIGASGKIGLVVFDGVQGQGHTLAIGGNTFPGSTTVTVFAPGGATVLSAPVSYGTSYKLDLGFLPASGTYTIRFQPTAPSTGSLVATVFADAAVPLSIDGPAAAMSVAAGQNGTHTFSGATGDLFSLAVTSLSTVPASTGVTFAFYRPDGALLYSYTWSSPTALSQLPAALPTTGTYRLRVVPGGVASASVSVLLSRPLTGTLSTSGTVTRFQSARAGQTGSYTFVGTAGQRWTLRATADATFAGMVTVYAPGGATLASAALGPNKDAKLDLWSLAVSGTHKVEVTPTGIATGAVDLRLVPEVAVALAIGGPAAAMSVAAGQNGAYTFAGAAGDVFSFAVTSLSTLPASAGVTFAFYKPDGALLYSYTLSSPTALSQLPAALPTTGTYRLRVVPGGAASASVSVLLSGPLTGTLATSGAVTRFQSSRAGQTGSYTFVGTAGQGWTLRATADATFAGTVTAYAPGGATLASATLGTTKDAKLDLGRLAVSGTYKVAVVPAGLATGAVDLKLVPEAVGSLVIGGASKGLALAAAQNGRYTFSGSQGDLVSLVVSSPATVPSGTALALSILRPDGAVHFTGSAASPVTWSVASLPAAGTYTLRIVPGGVASATLGVELRRR